MNNCIIKENFNKIPSNKHIDKISIYNKKNDSIYNDKSEEKIDLEEILPEYNQSTKPELHKLSNKNKKIKNNFKNKNSKKSNIDSDYLNDHTSNDGKSNFDEDSNIKYKHLEKTHKVSSKKIKKLTTEKTSTGKFSDNNKNNPKIEKKEKKEKKKLKINNEKTEKNQLTNSNKNKNSQLKNSSSINNSCLTNNSGIVGLNSNSINFNNQPKFPLINLSNNLGYTLNPNIYSTQVQYSPINFQGILPSHNYFQNNISLMPINNYNMLQFPYALTYPTQSYYTSNMVQQNLYNSNQIFSTINGKNIYSNNLLNTNSPKQ